MRAMAALGDGPVAHRRGRRLPRPQAVLPVPGPRQPDQEGPHLLRRARPGRLHRPALRPVPPHPTHLSRVLDQWAMLWAHAAAHPPSTTHSSLSWTRRSGSGSAVPYIGRAGRGGRSTTTRRRMRAAGLARVDRRRWARVGLTTRLPGSDSRGPTTGARAGMPLVLDTTRPHRCPLRGRPAADRIDGRSEWRRGPADAAARARRRSTSRPDRRAAACGRQTRATAVGPRSSPGCRVVADPSEAAPRRRAAVCRPAGRREVLRRATGGDHAAPGRLASVVRGRPYCRRPVGGWRTANIKDFRDAPTLTVVEWPVGR